MLNNLLPTPSPFEVELEEDFSEELDKKLRGSARYTGLTSRGGKVYATFERDTTDKQARAALKGKAKLMPELRNG